MALKRMSTANSNTTMADATTATTSDDSECIVIAGGGLVGLVLALAIQKHVGVTPAVYERVSSFQDVGAGMGLYANGLRVVRDISPLLLEKIVEEGFPFRQRKWERHDGTEVALAKEDVLAGDDDQIQSLGIRRWKLQSILYQAVIEAGIPVYFDKEVTRVEEQDEDGFVHVEFRDGSLIKTQILFGADGTNSTVRKVVNPTSNLEYSGIECVMGMAETSASDLGICFPSALTTRCHGCFFPTSTNEECFQMYFSVQQENTNPGNWGTLSEQVGKEQCRKLSEQMGLDGWNDKYIAPLMQVTRAVRVGFCSLSPPLQKWVYGRVVLVGDAAHPPMPYTGQGAQMGLEDAGTIALLLKALCLDENGNFLVAHFDTAMKLYERIRIPRTGEIHDISKCWAKTQEQRYSQAAVRRHAREEKIKRDVFFHETVSDLIPGSTYKYRDAIDEILKSEQVNLSALLE